MSGTKRLYDVYDTVTGEYMIRGGLSTDVVALTGIETHRIAYYANHHYKWAKRWIIYTVGTYENPDKAKCDKLMQEWDATRMQILQGARRKKE